MSENQQMSNLIESRHRNQIEQKKNIEEKESKLKTETKQINKTPASSNRFISIYDVLLNVCVVFILMCASVRPQN